MSLALRQWVVHHRNTIFHDQSQRDDLLNPARTNTDLIAVIVNLLEAGHIIEFTAIRSDHHDDSDLGPHCHFYGFCFDCWPLKPDWQAGAYEERFVDQDGVLMQSFLSILKDAGCHVGLGGSSWNETTRKTLDGAYVFKDGTEDHIHIGVTGE